MTDSRFRIPLQALSNSEEKHIQRRLRILMQEYQEKILELSLVRRITDILKKKPSIEKVCLSILNIILEEVPCNHSSLFLMKKDKEGLVLAAAQGQGDTAGRFYGIEGELRFRIGEGIAGIVVQKKKVIRIGDVQRDHRFVPNEEIGASVPIRSLLCLPLVAHRKVLGAFILSSSVKDTFTIETERIMNIIAAQAAMILRNVELLEEYRLSNIQLKKTFSLLQKAEQKLQKHARKLESDVARSDEQYKTLFENAVDGVIIHDSKGKIILANPAIAKILGYSLNHIIGSNLRRYVTLSHLKILERKYLKGNASDSCNLIEIEFQTSSGKYVFLELTSSVLHRRGKIREIQAIARDITEKKQLERQLAQSEKLAAMGQMVSGVAHELNNPLSIILGYVELLMERRVESLRQQDYLKQVHNATMRGIRVIENLLGFAKQQELKKEKVNIITLLDNTIKLLQKEISDGNINIRKQYKRSRFLTTAADPYLIQQVFLNVINNAVDALVEIEEPPVLEISASRSRGDIIIEFKDNGPGIHPDVQDSLFQPFVTTKKSAKGTGLGLSLCYGIIREHEGQIYWDRDYKKGARFKIYLPIKKAPLPSKSSGTDFDKAYNLKGTILIIEDEEDVAAFQKITLEERGLTVEIARSGSEGYSRLIEKEYDLVLIDMKMPGEMNGKDVYNKISVINPALARRFIFITGDLMTKETHEFLRKTPCLVIPKPFKLNTYVESVLEILFQFTK